MEQSQFFQDFLQCLSTKIPDISYKTWFGKLKLVSEENNNFIFEVENKFKKDFIVQHYSETIEDVLENIVSSNFTFDVVIHEEKDEEEVIVEVESDIPKLKSVNDGLLSKYTFDNYIVGDSNRLAQASALAVAEQPGKIYNPLFLYGKSGVGKTHLMMAIGNFIKQNTDKKVLYVSIETFINDFISINIKKNKDNNSEMVDYFKNKYRNVDVLIIDDIQLLANTPKTQVEFFSTFDYLHQSNKQIIVSSDRSPNDLKLLEDRITTRFVWGLTLCISPPEYDLRVKILKNKIAGMQINSLIKPEVFDYIANNFDSDVRHLEGAINTLCANVALYKPKEINLDFAMEVLREHIGSNIYIYNNIAKIQKAVADYFDITVENLKSKKRNANISEARHIAIYLCKMTTDETLERIGLEFNKNHASVIYAADKVAEELKTNEKLKQQIKEIKEKILN